MGKVVRTVAKIAAVAALVVATGGAAAGLAIFGTTAGVTAFGLSIGSLMTIAAVSSAVGAMFAKKPGGLANSNRERLYATINPDTARKQVFGRTAMATDVRYHEYTGTDQEYYWQVIALASHAVEAIEELWFDEKLAWTAGSGVTGDFSGYLTVWAVAEGSAANITSISSTWGPASNRRLTGIAHLDLRFKTTGNSKKTQSPFASSIPSRVTVVGKGRKVYDPRLDSTAGGSGAHRATNQATWQYANGATVLGNNCALVLLNYMLGWKIGGRLAVGKGHPVERLNMASFITAANVCDELVTLAAGGSERRYRWDGVISEGDAGDGVISELLASMNAELTDDGGQLSLRCRVNDLASPVIADLSADDVVGGFEWQPKLPLNEHRNIVRGKYVDASSNSLYQTVDYPAISISSPDGIERTETLDFAGVQSASQAQRLAKQWLQRLIYSGVFTAEFKARAWGLRVGDAVKWTSFSPLGAGFDNKLFRVVERSNPMNGRVRLKLREENAAFYAWSAEDSAPVTAAAPTLYDWTKAPTTAELAAIESGATRNVNRGAWSAASVVYAVGDEVSAAGSSYACVTAHTSSGANGPPGALWTLKAAAGSPGANGTNGTNGIDGVDGVDGASAKGVTVTATSAFFPFDAAGAAISQTVTFKAVRQNTTVQTQWTIRDRAGGSVTGNAAYIASTFPTAFTRVDDDTLTMTHMQFVAWIAGMAVRETTTVEATITDGVTVSDSVTIQKADASAVLPVLTNQADNVAADAAGNVASFAGLGGTMKLFAGGSTPITSGITFSLASSTGVTVTINSSTGVYAPTAMSASTGTATLRATYAGKTYDLIYSISKAIAGTAGTNGANGTNGTNGIDGAQGISSRIVFQRAATVPATPAASAGTPSGWYDTTTAVPAGSNPMWSTTGSSPLGGGNYTWGAPVRVEAISANQTGESTGAFYTTSATLSFVLNPGQSRNVYIQGDVSSPTGSGNVYPQIEYREAGGSWTASNGTTWTYANADPVPAMDLNHAITVSNSGTEARTYEVRGTIVRSNTNSGAINTALSFLRI